MSEMTMNEPAGTTHNAEAKFWDGIAKKYAAKPVADEEAFERKKAATRELLTPESTVLEIGCGTGSLALEMYAEDGPPADMGWGMYEGAELLEPTRRRYLSNVGEGLVRPVQAILEADLEDVRGTILEYFDAFEAYLLLDDRAHLVGRRDWWVEYFVDRSIEAFGSRTEADPRRLRERFGTHFHAYAEALESGTAGERHIDQRLVDIARRVVGHRSGKHY